MIVVELMGGLGNQMFQYAFGLRLATERQTSLVANGFLLNSRLIATLRQYTFRQFELSVFGIDWPGSSPATLLQACLPFQTNTALILESNTSPEALCLPPLLTTNIVCVGYWQSEQYFKSAESVIRQQFRFKKPVSEFTNRIAQHITTTPNSVFIHVRRGDYVSNTNASRHHGVCGIDYYQKALVYLKARIDNPHFFLFSDDLVWVKQQLGPYMEQATYVDGNRGPDSWQDMYLMSLCDHAILANSSFSWWGAWLHASLDFNRLVIAPAQWFANKQTPDLLPNGWVSL